MSRQRGKILIAALLFGALLLVTGLPGTAADAEPVRVTVDLLEGEENAEANFSLLRSVLESADGKTKLAVRIAEPGIYPLSSGTLRDGSKNARGLRLRSHTQLDLNGATLLRSGGMRNLFQTADCNDDSGSIGGYGLATDITLKNGVLDGAGGYKGMANLINLGHASGVELRDLEIRNCVGSHLVELSGCENCLITNCVFSGFTDTGSNAEPGEAIQLDICHRTADGDTWNGVYLEDGTVCRYITVENCTFLDYPSGVGNHHTLYGKHSHHIIIRNNRFLNTLDSTVAAVWCYGFDDSAVCGNVFSGSYGYAVLVSGGSVEVTDNTVGTENMPVSCIPILLTRANADRTDGQSGHIEQSVTGGSIVGNTVYTTCDSKSAISVFNGARLTAIDRNTVFDSSDVRSAISLSDCVTDSLSGNTILSHGGRGIYLSSGARAEKIEKNSITADRDYGIYLTGASALKIAFNTVTAKSGIALSGGAAVKAIKGNTLEASSGNAVYLTRSGSSISYISNNTLRAPSGSGIYLTASALLKATGNDIDAKTGFTLTNGSAIRSISDNTVTARTGNGIMLNKSGNITSYISGNTLRAPSGSGIYLTASTLLKATGNDIDAKTGFTLTNGSVIRSISDNTVTARTGNGIMLNKSGSSLLTIGSNTVTAAKGSAVYLTGAKAKKITKNTIPRPGKYGVAIVSSSKVLSVSYNTVSSPTGDGIYISSATVTGIKYNTVTRGKARGIAATSSGKVSAIQGNTVKSCKSIGIAVLNTSLKKVTVTGNTLKKNKAPLAVKAKGTIQKK